MHDCQTGLEVNILHWDENIPVVGMIRAQETSRRAVGVAHRVVGEGVMRVMLRHPDIDDADEIQGEDQAHEWRDAGRVVDAVVGMSPRAPTRQKPIGYRGTEACSDR